MSPRCTFSPGSLISPDSTTSTSGRLATSSADRSSGRATSVMTAPGLTCMMSRTRLPAPEVAVTMASISGSASSGVAATKIFARGLPISMSALRASSFAASGLTIHSSSLAMASRRAHTLPMAPVAPTTIVLPRRRPLSSTWARSSLASASCSAHSAPEAEYELPVVMGSGARLATVTPASPTTLVKAPRPMIWAPSFLAMSAACSSRE